MIENIQLVRSKLNHTLVETRINGQHQLSHALVNRLIFFVVETGMMTGMHVDLGSIDFLYDSNESPLASVAIVSIITFLAFPVSFCEYTKHDATLTWEMYLQNTYLHECPYVILSLPVYKYQTNSSALYSQGNHSSKTVCPNLHDWLSLTFGMFQLFQHSSCWLQQSSYDRTWRSSGCTASDVYVC